LAVRPSRFARTLKSWAYSALYWCNGKAQFDQRTNFGAFLLTSATWCDDSRRIKGRKLPRKLAATVPGSAFPLAVALPKSKGAEFKVGVIDTGVHAAHFALKNRVKGFVVIDPAGNRMNASPEFDAAQHGTHVCRTIAGGTTEERLAIGVASGVQLLAAAVMLGNATLAGVIEAISRAVENGADIINMSLGFSYYEPLFANILERLLMKLDVLPGVSIGNSSHGNTSCPGNVAHALSVGAVDGGDPSNLSVAFFSGGASFVFPGAHHNQMITKPGVPRSTAQVFSAIPPQTRQDGRHLYAYMNGYPSPARAGS
jgi:subtilisin family serine protease